MTRAARAHTPVSFTPRTPSKGNLVIGPIGPTWGCVGRGRKKPNRKLFGWDFKTFRGYVECWAIWGLCWAYGGLVRYMGFHGGLWAGKNNPSRQLFGSMLGDLECMWGPCWVIWWATWGSMEVSGQEKTTPTKNWLFPKALFWNHFRAMWGQCWAIWGLCWAHVGSLGVLF